MSKTTAAQCRLNFRVSKEELQLLKLGAELYAGGNMSKLIRHLTLSILPDAHKHIARDTDKVALKVIEERI